MEEEIKINDKNNNDESLKYKSWKDRFIAFINGVLIGLAIIVPGVSGSTISMIFKLYDKMMKALSNLFKRFKICFLFLLPILIGALIGFVGGFFAVKSVIEQFTFICVCLFAGLMLGGASEVAKEIKIEDNKKRTTLDYVLLIIGFIFPIGMSLLFYYLTDFVSMNDLFSSSSFPFYLYIICFILGIAISLTQIIPGLSATALLMCFGAFTPIMDSVSLTVWEDNPMWLLIYVCLVLGFIVGMLLFSNIITKLLDKNRFTTFHLLTGLAYGSVIGMFCNTEIISVYINYSQGAGNIALDLGIGIPLFVIAFIGSFLLVKYGLKHK